MGEFGMTLNFCGDSITFGLTHCTAEETFVACLGRLFEGYAVTRYDGNRPSGYPRVAEYEKIIVSTDGEPLELIRNGVGGETVKRALERVDQLSGVMPNGREPDYTFLMYGINDAASDNPEKYAPPAVFKEQYRRLLEELRQRNPHTTFILMTPTYNVLSVEEHAAFVRLLAQEMGLLLIDLNLFWAKNAQNDWLLPPDTCHPTPTAASAMADYIFEEFKKIAQPFS